MARGLVGAGEFFEVFVDTPLAVAEERDPKGLYAQGAARRAEELHRHRLAVRSAGDRRDPHRHHAPDAEEAADVILQHLRSAGMIDAD